MPAVQSLLQLYTLEDSDGAITAFDCYGNDLHIGTSTGQLLHLAVSDGTKDSAVKSKKCPAAKGGNSDGHNAGSSPSTSRRDTRTTSTTSRSQNETKHSPQSTPASSAARKRDGVVTTVVRRCTVSSSSVSSNSGTATPVQQVQHSRIQRVLFVLCDGRLQLLHAEDYTVLCNIASDVVSFSVAQPASLYGGSNTSSTSSRVEGGASGGGYDSTGGAGTEAFTGLPSRHHVHSRVHTGPSTGPESGATLHSRTVSLTRTSSDISQGDGSPHWTPRTARSGGGGDGLLTPASPISSSTTPRSHHQALRHSSPSDKTYVVCVAERNRKELAVYIVDRVSTASTNLSSAQKSSVVQAQPTHSHQSSSLPSSAFDVGCPVAAAERDRAPLPAPLTTRFTPPPPRVVLRQRYLLPELAQRVLMCAPAPVLPRPRSFTAAPSSGLVFSGPPLPLERLEGSPATSGAAPSRAAMEAGLTVCVGMRREVSLLPLLGGAPKCVLRLDGGRPPLLSVGTDYNTYLVRTQAPNTVMEVGVPPAAAVAGLWRGEDSPSSNPHARDGLVGASLFETAVNPIVQRLSFHRLSATANRSSSSSASPSPLLHPSYLSHNHDEELITGDVFQSDAAVEFVLARFPYIFLFTDAFCDVVSLLGSATAGAAHQRLPLPGIRHGGLRGQGTAVYVASDHAIWLLRLYPLRVQLAELVRAGDTDDAFQLLAFHQQRAMSSASASHRSRSTAGKDGGYPEQPLRALETELHRMAGFACLHRGEVAAAVRYFRGRLDPRELLLSLPDCMPPRSVAAGVLRGGAQTGEMSGLPARETWSAVGGYVLHHSEVGVPCSVVRALLSSDHDKSSGTVVPTLATSEEDEKTERRDGGSLLPSPPLSSTYWASWSGPCVYNSYAGDLARAWRDVVRSAADAGSAFQISTAQDSDEGEDSFSASCFDALKAEVRLWFAEELFLSERGVMLDDARCTSTSSKVPCATAMGAETTPPGSLSEVRVPHTLEQGAAAESATNVPLAQTSSVEAYRRAMAYASLVLAWQARDFRMAHKIVSAAALIHLHVEDCVDMLAHLQEYRLLALLYFRSGRGAACWAVLRQRVCGSAVLLPRAVAVSRLAAASYVPSQLSQWRQRMRKKVRTGCWAPSSDREGAHSEKRVEELTCGLGLMLQPSVQHVANAAQLLFGIDSNGSPSGSGSMCAREASQPNSGVEVLLDHIIAYYLHETDSRSEGGVTDSDYCLLHFGALQEKGASGTQLTLPHMGPLLTPTSTLTSSVPVLPPAFSEFLYAVEKLDLCTVRQLLTRAPRLAQLRDIDGSTGLHVALRQVRVVCASMTLSSATASARHTREQEELSSWQRAHLELVCSLCGLLVHGGCPVGAVNCYGWSCLDAAALACRGNTTVFDVVTSALLAVVELRAAASVTASAAVL